MLVLKTRGSTILLLRKSKAMRLGKTNHKQNATNANLTYTTSNEESNQRKSDKCPSVPRKKSVFWKILASFSVFWLINSCAGFKSFVSAKISFSTTQKFSITRKTIVKKAASKPQGGFLFLYGKVLQFNCEWRLLFTVNRNCLVFIHDLERLNEFLRLNSHVIFSSNKLKLK